MGKRALVDQLVRASPRSGVPDIQGTYPVYAEAYRDLAKEIGIPLMQLQSIAWEHKN